MSLWIAIKEKLALLSPAPMLAWVKKGFSSDPSVSVSRILQAAIVFSLIPLVWIVVAKSGWTFSDNTRLIVVCLIVSGAGGYITSKIKDGGQDPPKDGQP